MAPALTSNFFRVATTPHSNTESRVTKPRVAVYALQNPFRIGKPKDEEEALEGKRQDDEGAGKPNRFFFDFGKIPDAKSLMPVLSSPSTSLFANRRRKEPNTVFVAGATGQSGTRIAQMLLRQGFVVRAGVPELASAQDLARLAATYKIISPEESKRLNAVESTFQDSESIAKAIGPATKVVVTVGPGEKGPVDEVTTDDALQVIRAAQLAGVSHVAVVYDSGAGTQGSSSTYNVLDGITSFFSNIFARSQPLTLEEFLSKIVETDVSYTLIKAALTEDYSTESSYGLVVSSEGTIPGTPKESSKVSKSQIAKLVADVFSNTTIAENKVVEVSTSPSATSKPVVELFSAIPEDGRRKAYGEAMAKAEAEAAAIIASEKAREASKAAKKLEEEVKKLSKQEAQAASLAEEAREKAEAAGSSLENLLTRAKDFGGGGEFSWAKLRQIAAAVSQKESDEKPTTQIATIRGQAKAWSLPPQRAVIRQPAPKPKPKQSESKPEPKPKQPVVAKAEMRNVFGGLFKQETVYVDDD